MEFIHTPHDDIPPDETDLRILADRVAAWNAVPGPRVGDYVEMPAGDNFRISYCWSDAVQISDCGSFHLDRGFMTFSGSLYPAVPVDKIVDTGRTKVGTAWFFHHGQARAHNAVQVRVPCRVYRHVDADRRPAVIRELGSLGVPFIIGALATYFAIGFILAANL